MTREFDGEEFDSEDVMETALRAMYVSLDGGDIAAGEGRLLEWADGQANPRLAMLKLVLCYQGMLETMLVEAYGREGAETVVRQQLVFLSGGGSLADIPKMLEEGDPE